MREERTGSLADFVRIVARGSGRARTMTQSEAAEAMRLMLSGHASPEAVGALLMVLRYRGEMPEEIAGFVSAARAELGVWANLAVDLDWPSYAAGSSRGAPYFLLAALLLAEKGVAIAMHGTPSHAHGGVLSVLPLFGITPARSVDEAGAQLAARKFAYLPLGALSQRLLDLLRLREQLGLRSCINTVLRLLNPCKAQASIQGAFHAPYIRLHIEAGRLLGNGRMAVFKGGGGEAERNPFKKLAVSTLFDGAAGRDNWPALVPGLHRRLNEGESTDPAMLLALWRGETSDATAEAIVTGTAAIALATLGRATAKDADRMAESLWRGRNRLAFPQPRQAA